MLVLHFWLYELPWWGHQPGWRLLQSSTWDQGKLPSRRILAVVWHGEGCASPCEIAQDSPHEMTTRKDNIPARSSPKLSRTAPFVTHQGRGVKCTTGVPNKKIRARSNTIIGTWNVRALKNTGKLEELEHELTRYNWKILGLCESQLLKDGEKSTQEGHRLYWSGLEDTHEQCWVHCAWEHCELRHDLLPNFKQTHYHPSEG